MPETPRLMTPVRVGLVGCGRVAEFGYLPAFRAAVGVSLVGVADVDPTRCGRIAPGVPAYGGLQGLIEAEGLEALVIATPTRFHLANARCAAAARLPALVEKPPGVDGREAMALHELRPSPRLAFNRRFEASMVALKNRVRGCGDLRLRIELHYRRRSWNPIDVRDDALLDLGPHLIDLARWLSGREVTSARARSLRAHRAEFELRLGPAHAMISCSSDRPHTERVVASDGNGRVLASEGRGGLVASALARLRPTRENPLVRSLVGQLEAFGQAVRGLADGSPLATTADGVAVMSVIDAVRRSAGQGGIPVPVPGLLGLAEEAR